MNCPCCNQTLSPKASFCRFCGTHIDSDAVAFAKINPETNAAAPTIPSNMCEAVRRCFSLYSVSKGRASRSEFWYWSLFVVLTLGFPLVCLSILENCLDAIGDYAQTKLVFCYLLVGIFIVGMLALLCPTINVLVRRLHDVNYSDSYAKLLALLIARLPVLLPLFLPVLLIILLTEGTEGYNKYGPQPVKS